MTVEFLPPDDAGDEPPPAPGPGRARPIWALLAVLAVGAAVLAAIQHGSGSSPVAEPTRAATPTAAVPSERTVAPAPDPACAGIPDCSAHDDVPRSIVRLARTYLPAGVRLRVHTVVAVNSLTHDDVLVQRDIEALVDSVRIVIRVQRGGPATEAIVPDPPGVGSLLLHQVNSGYVVRLQYVAPATVAPSADRLQALIRDPELAVG